MVSDPNDRDDDQALRARLNRLSSELKRRAAPPPAPQPKRKVESDAEGSAMSLGLRAGSEFISAVIVGSGIGWGFDRALGTNPAFLIVFFLVGVAAGMWNVIRLTSPKGASLNRDSPLSRAEAPDKDVQRSGSPAERDASLPRRGAVGGPVKPSDGADEDED